MLWLLISLRHAALSIETEDGSWGYIVSNVYVECVRDDSS